MIPLLTHFSFRRTIPLRSLGMCRNAFGFPPSFLGKNYTSGTFSWKQGYCVHLDISHNNNSKPNSISCDSRFKSSFVGVLPLSLMKLCTFFLIAKSSRHKELSEFKNTTYMMLSQNAKCFGCYTYITVPLKTGSTVNTIFELAKKFMTNLTYSTDLCAVY